MGAGPRRDRGASTPGLQAGTASRFGAGRRWVRVVCPGLEPGQCGSNSDRLARLFLDGISRVEEPLFMSTTQEQRLPTRAVFVLQSFCVSE